jgi:hypothetical protein
VTFESNPALVRHGDNLWLKTEALAGFADGAVGIDGGDVLLEDFSFLSLLQEEMREGLNVQNRPYPLKGIR